MVLSQCLAEQVPHVRHPNVAHFRIRRNVKISPVELAPRDIDQTSDATMRVW